MDVKHDGDADPLSEEVVKVRRATSPAEPKAYRRRGEQAEAVLAVLGRTTPVADLFE